MQFVTNADTRTDHRRVLRRLIDQSESMVLCSGWINHGGLRHLLHPIDRALGRQARITLYSNSRHTDADSLKALRERPGLRHVLADDAHRYLHSKLYHFEHGGQFTALVGSGNITQGGLSRNEELSICLRGAIGDPVHRQIGDYLARLETVLRA